VVHVEDLIKAGAEQILCTGLAPLAGFTRRMALRFTSLEQVNHTFPSKGIANLYCKKNVHTRAYSCNPQNRGTSKIKGISAA